MGGEVHNTPLYFTSSGPLAALLLFLPVAAWVLFSTHLIFQILS
jgi:tryptophan-rich sensory protein